MRWLVLIAVLVVASCADPAAVARHEAAMNAYVGQSELDLVHKLGVPSRSYDVDGRRFLAYSRRSIDVWPGMSFGGFGPFGYGGGVPPQVVQWACDTTFELVGGRVIGWQQRGNNC